MKYAIYEGNLDRLEKKLKRIFNKCKAYGCDFHYEQTGEEFRELKDEKGNKYTARFVLVEAEGTAVINDWEFVAELEHTEKAERHGKQYDLDRILYTKVRGCFCMIREVDLVSYLPPFMQSYKEPVAALEAENPEFSLMWSATDRCLRNRFISTADEYGISRFEKMLKIYPTADDTLESRRSRVQSKWFNTIPYTWKVLLQKLLVLCGDSDFEVTGDFKTGYTLYIDTDLELYGQVEELENIINTMIPENLVVVSKNSIPCNIKGAVLFGGGICFINEFIITNDFREVFDVNGSSVFGGGIVQTEMLNITNDSQETVSVQGTVNFGGKATDTAMVTISTDFNEIIRADMDAKAASGVVQVDFIEIKTT